MVTIIIEITILSVEETDNRRSWSTGSRGRARTRVQEPDEDSVVVKRQIAALLLARTEANNSIDKVALTRSKLVSS